MWRAASTSPAAVVIIALFLIWWACLFWNLVSRLLGLKADAGRFSILFASSIRAISKPVLASPGAMSISYVVDEQINVSRVASSPLLSSFPLLPTAWHNAPALTIFHAAAALALGA